jgi:hypothetical protein
MAARLASQAGYRSFHFVRAAAIHDHLRTRLLQPAGNSKSYAFSRAGHKGDLSGKVNIHCNTPLMI